MILRIFGNPAPREQMIFLICLTIALTTSEFDATRLNERRGRKASKRDESKSRISNQNDFPYRYVFPANHPFSTYQYLNSPTPPYQNQNMQNQNYPHFDYATQYANQQPDIRYLKQYPQLQFSQNSLQPPQYPPSQYQSTQYQPTQSPLIFLLQPGAPNGMQTFVLLPANPENQALNQLPINQPLVLPSMQLPTVSPSGIPARSNILPLSLASLPPQLFAPPITSAKSSFQNNLNTQLLQRPFYQFQQSPGKYYPQKKSSIESKMGSSSKHQSEVPRRLSTTTDRPTERIVYGTRVVQKSNSTV